MVNMKEKNFFFVVKVVEKIVNIVEKNFHYMRKYC